MREYNANFHLINEQDEKEPRYVLALSFDSANTDIVYLTSHKDCDVPAGATVIYGVLSKLSGTSQKLDPIKALSLIGNLSFQVKDISQTLTTTIYNKLYPAGDGVPVDGLRHKRVQLYIGFVELVFADYEIPAGGTQIITNISYSIDNGNYYFDCSDIQRTIRKSFCDPETTNLIETITSTQKGIPIGDPTKFLTVFHGPSYSDSPNESVGYIEFNRETIAWRGKLNTLVTVSGTDIYFQSNKINSTSTDLSVFSDKQHIVITNTALNNGVYEITGTPTTNQLGVAVVKFTSENAGPSFTVTAPVQVYDCTRGALNTKAIEHIVSPNTDIDRRPEVKEVIYVQLPAVKALLGFLTGNIHGDASTFPPHWHLNIGPSNIQTSAFTGIGTDWWDTEDDTKGVPCRFVYLDKIDGKAFVERELLLLLGAFMPVTSTGELSLKRMTYVGIDTPYHHYLDKTNIISISKLKHAFKSVYNRFLFKWNYDHIEKDFTRKELLVDLVSLGAHSDTPVLVVPFKGMHGATYTKARAHLRRDSARDRYIGPPEIISVVCSPELNKVEIADICRLYLVGLPDFVSNTDINRSFEAQRVAINWENGRVTLLLFGSTQRPEPLPTISSTNVIPDANYTSIGVDISTVTNGTDVGGTWTINADSTLYGSGTMGSLAYAVGTVSTTNGSKIITGSGTTWNALKNTNINIDSVEYEIDTIDSNTQITLLIDYTGTTAGGKTYNLYGAIYYWDGDIELQSNKTLTIFDNVRIRYKGEFNNNGFVDGIGNGRHGSIVTNTPGEIGWVGNTKAGGGIVGWALSLVSNYTSNDSVITSGENIGIPNLHIEYDGTDVVGLDDLDMRPSSGGSGNESTFSGGFFAQDINAGGFGANGGAAFVLEGRGVNAGISSTINLSGADGLVGTKIPLNGTADLYPGTGAGGAGGPLLVILDGSFPETSDVFTNFISNRGSSVPIGHIASAVVLAVSGTNTSEFTPYAEASSYYVGFPTESNKGSLYKEIRLADFATPVLDVATISDNPTALLLSEGVSSKQSVNLAAIEISVTPPSGDNSYRGSTIKVRVTGDGEGAFTKVGEVIGTEEIVIQVPNYNNSYDFRAYPFSIAGIESKSFIEESISITGTSLSTTLTPGSHLKSGQTEYNTGNGFFLGGVTGNIKLTGLSNLTNREFLGDLFVVGHCWSNDGLKLFLTTLSGGFAAAECHSIIPYDIAGLPTDVSPGNVDVVNGSPIVTLPSGSWSGYHNTKISIFGTTYTILSYDSNTQITLTSNYIGSTGNKTPIMIIWDAKSTSNVIGSAHIAISMDGTKLFIIKNSEDIREHTSTVPNSIIDFTSPTVKNLHTLLGVSPSLSFNGLVLKPDGTRCIVSTEEGVAYAIDMPTPNTLVGATNPGESAILVGGTAGYIKHGLGIIPNGKQLLVTQHDDSGNTKVEFLLYNLPTSWSLVGLILNGVETIVGSFLTFFQITIDPNSNFITTIQSPTVSLEYRLRKFSVFPSVQISFGAGDGVQDVTYDGKKLVYNGDVYSELGGIGGWNTTATTIVSDNNRVIMDAGNQWIEGRNAAGNSYARIDLDGLKGVDNVWGVTFSLPTDNSHPFLGVDFRINGGVSYANILNTIQGRLVDFQLDLIDAAGAVESKSAGIYNFENTTSGTGTDKSQLIYSPIRDAFSWNKNRLFKTSVAPKTGSNLGDVSIYIGDSSGSNNHIGFRFDGDGNIYAILGNSGSSSETNIRTYVDDINYILEIKYTVTQILFLVNNILEHTASSNLPNGITDANGILTLEIFKNNVGVTGIGIKVDEFNFQQDTSDDIIVDTIVDALIITENPATIT